MSCETFQDWGSRYHPLPTHRGQSMVGQVAARHAAFEHAYFGFMAIGLYKGNRSRTPPGSISCMGSFFCFFVWDKGFLRWEPLTAMAGVV